ncbi:MAG: AAA family ATPase [Phycisphaerales bacterium]|nr:MAG: AAA family ATPase [Phycisphaerales bacterium]
MISEDLFSGRLRKVLRDLIRLSAQREEAEKQTEDEYRAARQEAQQTFDEASERIDTRYDREKSEAESDYRQTSGTIEEEFHYEYNRTQLTFDSSRSRITEQAEHSDREVRRRLEEAQWIAETVYEAKENQPQLHLDQARELLETAEQDLTDLEEQAAKLLKRYRQRPPSPEADQGDLPAVDRRNPGRDLADRQAEAQRCLAVLEQVPTARLFRGPWLILAALALLILAAAAAGWFAGWTEWTYMVGAAGATLLLEAVVVVSLHAVARRRVRVVCRMLHNSVRGARAALEECQANAEAERDRQQAELIARRDLDIREADEKYTPMLGEIAQRRDEELKRINEKYPRLLVELKQRREDDLRQCEQRYRDRLAAATKEHETDSRQAKKEYDGAMADSQSRHDEQWSKLEADWKEGMSDAYAVIHEINGKCEELFPDWNAPLWDRWTPPTTFAPAIRFGQLQVNMARIPGGVPQDERLLLDEPTNFPLPAMLAFPDQCSLLLESGAEGRGQAVQTLQLVMLRLLTTLPPGKVRFTIIDPVGLGQSFAGFMHLADHMESLVGGKIWTETRHIEQRLADLTEHMENVIQKYLRNEYETIGQYNEEAGEIAEPFRFLVIADFPVNFSDTAARRLASIVNSGMRCGVYTLIAMDTRQSLPQGIQVKDLRQNSATLVHQKDRFVWQDDDFNDLPLMLDSPPAEDFLTHTLQIVGQSAKDSSRVEVPFRVITPPRKRQWAGDTSQDVSVPLGRAGATKLQRLTLGHGTAQHALIAGKTGSGKSTLLHVLVTNLSLWYSPRQVEFYLVDFKKGVEFKTYANHELPHARAVAIESDREFGLSVLQRIDRELKGRGNRFRELGVQDLAAYRRLPDVEPMPRTLLIIDEFQELFVEDDKIGQDAALLLDRLVRQGRAFGIHVLLGSQTLGGAYSLARSTLEQMAVRIALQCSEADSYLILSDDNAAARLLARPGEAIYNDANGTVEGNSPFQICWLPEDDREESLQRVAELAAEQEYRRPEPQIVFEGNVPADLNRNQMLNSLISAGDWPEPTAAPHAWLGEAIAIKDPTAAVLRRQSGTNLLIIGQREESALAMLCSSLFSLALQHQPGDASFYVLDGSPVDSTNAGYINDLAETLPHETHIIDYRHVPEAMNELIVELQRRQDKDQTDAPAVYVLIYSLQRYRMLRFVEDFSFSMDEEGKPPAPDKQIASLLREGPALGMHVLTWCDTAANLERTFERQVLREFELRVLFQMGATDSSNLIDTPMAAKLGLRRALFCSEELGTLEKFRPYALPDEDWLERVKEQFAERG